MRRIPWLLVVAAVVAAGVAAPPAARADARRIPFWPDDVPAAIQARVDGDYILDAVRALGRFHRVHGSPGFRAAADWVKSELVAAGIADAEVEHLPADGKTRYAHFVSYYGWDPVEGRAEEIAPQPRVLAEFPALPVALADYSQDADVTADVIDVGAGAADADYAGKDVRDKIVLASGEL